MDIEEVAHVLSQQNRFNGDTPYPYSKAQHALLCSYLTSKKNAFDALHHLDDQTLKAPPSVHTDATEDASTRACRLELSLVLGRGDVAIAKLSLGQLTKLGDVIRLVRKMSSTRARDAYLERHYELIAGAPEGNEGSE